MLSNPSWRWGLSLIVLTMTIHAAAVLIVAFVGMKIRVQLEARSPHEWNLIAILICGTELMIDWTAIGRAAPLRVWDLGSGLFVGWRSPFTHGRLVLLR
jgi:hypothetical protein